MSRYFPIDLTGPTRRRASVKPKKRKYTSASNARVGGYIGQEVKFFDAGIASIVCGEMQLGGLSNAARISPITSDSLFRIPGGTGVSERDGRLVVITEVAVRGCVNIPSTVTPASINIATAELEPVTVCWALVLDKQTNKALMDPSEVYASCNTAQSQAGANDIVRQGCIAPVRNLEHAARYKVLDFGTKKMSTGIQATDTTLTRPSIAERRCPFQIDHKCRIPLRYEDTAAQLGAIAEMGDNSFHLLVWTDAVGTDPVFTGSVRVRFHNGN